MTYEDLIVLIPSHALEDLPTDLSESEAASLMNAFAVQWHPSLLVSANCAPSWRRADDPPTTLNDRLIIIPTICDDWLPHNWIDDARTSGATVISGISDRSEMLAAVLDPLTDTPPVDNDLAQDFLALGFCQLMMELLTRRMHHFGEIDELRLQREALAAAHAAVEHNDDLTRRHLGAAFECLTESRERFYPVECHLFDLCLLTPKVANDDLDALLSRAEPINILATAADLDEIASSRPAVIETLRGLWDDGTIDIAGGDHHEIAVPLVPLESMLRDLREGHTTFRRLFGRTPRTWARRRYGFSTLLPQILKRFGYHSALHVALDDGIYPDSEHARLRWEGCDGSVIDAMTRIPLAGDSSSAFLRLPSRMAETMEEDMVAAVTFARWPDLKTPWLNDLHRMAKYSATLGTFVTFDDFIRHTDAPGRMASYNAQEYLAPFLIQSVAHEEPDAISRVVQHFEVRRLFDAACWFDSLANLLRGRPPVDQALAEQEQLLEDSCRSEDAANRDAAITKAASLLDQSIAQFSETILTGSADGGGYLVCNPLSFARVVTIPCPELDRPPDIATHVKAVQFDASTRVATVEVPGSGFAWITAGASRTAPAASPPLAEGNVLRNEFFELTINEETGGIAKLKGYGRQPNRLSQQIAFRFPRERDISSDADGGDDIRSYYSEMRMTSMELRSTGPAIGEIRTTGIIVDQQNDSVITGFEQTMRIWRARPIIEIDIELLDVKRMPEGDPWSNFIACRFAWHDSGAALTRSELGHSQGFQGERIESPDYFEIASDNERTCIIHHGLPYHRKTGPRMLDSLLIVAGESKRRFRFTIAIDQNYPQQAALDAAVPAISRFVGDRSPAGPASGWLLHVPARNVLITRILPTLPLPVERDDADIAESPPDVSVPAELPREVSAPGVSAPGESAPGESAPGESSAVSLSACGDSAERHPVASDPGSPDAFGFALRLMETEGRDRAVKLRCFRSPSFARQRDFNGNTLRTLTIEQDSVLIDITGHEIADIEMRFD